MTRRIARTAQIGALVLALVLVPAAVAARGGGGKPGGTSGSSSVSQPVMVTDTGTPGLSYGDTVTFTVSTSASVPSVELDCYQNGAIVYQGTTGYYATYMWSNNYTLKSFVWKSGAADCTATLYSTNKNGSRTTLATLSFHVGA
jgi:hypothetical protein